MPWVAFHLAKGSYHCLEKATPVPRRYSTMNQFNWLNKDNLFWREGEIHDRFLWQTCRGFLQGVKGMAVGLKTV
jgi:hypothetical protein